MGGIQDERMGGIQDERGTDTPSYPLILNLLKDGRKPGKNWHYPPIRCIITGRQPSIPRAGAGQ